MSVFRIYENQWRWTEEAFRSRYGSDVLVRTMRCCGGMGEDDWCKNECHFLVAEGIEHVDDEGGFPVFGIDCDVEVICWGGDDVDNATIETYCKECAAAMHESRIKWDARR